jgi:SAM-dependent methyltransferase
VRDVGPAPVLTTWDRHGPAWLPHDIATELTNEAKSDLVNRLNAAYEGWCCNAEPGTLGRLVAGSSEPLPGLVTRFDFITTFDSVHDQAQPDLVLAGIAQALRPGGVYLSVDIAASSILSENLDHPFGPLGYTISCMHCMTVSLAEGGMGLGTMWGEQKPRRCSPTRASPQSRPHTSTATSPIRI